MIVRRVTATFDSREAAERAAAALVDLGADREQISTLARGESGTADTSGMAHREGDHMIEPAREVGDSGAALTTTDEHDATQGAATGAALGAVAGIAAGLASLLVPGFGLVTAGGALAWALGGAAGATAAGAVAGGVYGGLRDIGIEDQHARTYEERVRSGDVLLTAVVPNMDAESIRSVLEEHGAEYVTFADDTSSWTPRASAAASDYGSTAGVNSMAASGAAMSGTAADYRMPSSSGLPSTTAADYNSNVARGEAKQVEGEMRDRAADRTLNPLDDLAAKAEKAEGKLQEEYGEEAEEVETGRF
jgi:uncharacterized protein YjbJ (UPF0337 family)